MKKIIHKTVSLILIAWGLTFVVTSFQLAVDLFGDPELTLGGALFLSLMAFGISVSILYVGWRMWKNDKRAMPDVSATMHVYPGLGEQSGAAGISGARQHSVTVECPGCGAPVEVTPSMSGECEYCGTLVQFRHPSGAV